MGLQPGETRELARIENEIAGSDPALATMFAAFGTDPARTRAHCLRLVQPQLTRLWRAEAKWFAVLIVLAAGLIACITLAVLTA